MGSFVEEDKKRYVQVMDGQMVERVRPHTPGSIHRVNKLGKEVWEKHHAAYEGTITKIAREDSQFGMRLAIEFDRKDVVTVPWSSRYAKTFLAVFPNIELDNKIRLRPFDFVPDDKPDKRIRGWNVWQDDVKVEEAYARERLPQMKQVMVKGNKVWDDTELMDALWEGALKAWSKHNTGVVAAAAHTNDSLEAAEIDDVPF